MLSRMLLQVSVIGEALLLFFHFVCSLLRPSQEKKNYHDMGNLTVDLLIWLQRIKVKIYPNLEGGVVIEGDFCRNTQNPIGQKRYVLGRQNTGVFLCIFTSI